MTTLSDRKTEKVAEIISENTTHTIGNLLVVGCGSGLEAAILAQQLQADVVGIDVEDHFDSEAVKHARLEVGDAMALRFPDASFDFVYSYHALEHIDDPVAALQEIRRVLKDGGNYWIGTPNRHRLIGYLGSKNATRSQKLQWNLSDWKARLTGSFKNELGAHAGFSARELQTLLDSVFSSSNNVSESYYKRIYNSRESLISILETSALAAIAYPSVYFMGSA